MILTWYPIDIHHVIKLDLTYNYYHNLCYSRSCFKNSVKFIFNIIVNH